MTPLTPSFEEGPARAAPRHFPFANHRTLKEVMDGVQPPIADASAERIAKLLRWMDE